MFQTTVVAIYYIISSSANPPPFPSHTSSWQGGAPVVFVPWHPAPVARIQRSILSFINAKNDRQWLATDGRHSITFNTVKFTVLSPKHTNNRYRSSSCIGVFDTDLKFTWHCFLNACIFFHYDSPDYKGAVAFGPASHTFRSQAGHDTANGLVCMDTYWRHLLGTTV